MKSWFQRIFIRFLVRHLFNTVDEKDVLRMEGRNIYFLGKQLPQEDVAKLGADAKAWKDSLLWRIIDTECKWKANERMFLKSTNPADLVFGKAMNYLLVDVIEAKLEELSNL